MEWVIIFQLSMEEGSTMEVFGLEWEWGKWMEWAITFWTIIEEGSVMEDLGLEGDK